MICIHSTVELYSGVHTNCTDLATEMKRSSRHSRLRFAYCKAFGAATAISAIRGCRKLSRKGIARRRAPSTVVGGEPLVVSGARVARGCRRAHGEGDSVGDSLADMLTAEHQRRAKLCPRASILQP